MIARTCLLMAAASLLAGCRASPNAMMRDGPPPSLIEAARSHYDHYQRALRNGERERLASFYHHAGARIVLNGHDAFQSRATLDSLYRFRWTPPAFFTFDSLRFEAMPPGRVLVVGQFRWQRANLPDTSRNAYVAVLTAVDSGMAITFEHETRLAR